MREIKFRAWLPGINKMTDAHTLEELMGWGIEKWTHGTAEWMQYTGLKDKNGKEIYEGDIGYTLIGRYSDPKHIFLSVVKCDRCFWEFYEKERDTPHEIWPDDQFEIIGNVWEHPHLLEGRESIPKEDTKDGS